MRRLLAIVRMLERAGSLGSLEARLGTAGQALTAWTSPEPDKSANPTKAGMSSVRQGRAGRGGETWHFGTFHLLPLTRIRVKSCDFSGFRRQNRVSKIARKTCTGNHMYFKAIIKIWP